MKLPTRQLLALSAAAALLLAGCASDDGTETTDDSATAPAASTTDAPDAQALPETGGECVAEGDAGGATGEAALESVVLSDPSDDAPTVTFGAPLAIDAEVAHVAADGDGEAAAAGDLVTFNYIVCDIVTGDKLHSTWGLTQDANTPETYAVTTPMFGEVLAETLTGASSGTRVLWAHPGVTPEQSSTGEAVNGYLYAMDITGTTPVLDEASGTDVEVTDETLPTITMTDGKPAVSVPDAFADPDELVAQPLVEGEGATVEEGQRVMVKYTGWLTDGTQFDSSWDRQPPQDIFEFQVGAGQVIPGWDQGVEGQSVGSRVLLVIPSDLGYGEGGSGEAIPGGSTLIFVVDILAAY